MRTDAWGRDIRPAWDLYERVGPKQLHWRQHPNGGTVAAVAVPLDEAPGLIEQGWLKINGERAVIHSRLQDEVHNAFLRIEFDVPYPFPHP